MTRTDAKRAIRTFNGEVGTAVFRWTMTVGTAASLGMMGWALNELFAASNERSAMQERLATAQIEITTLRQSVRSLAVIEWRVDSNTDDIVDLSGRVRTLEER